MKITAALVLLLVPAILAGTTGLVNKDDVEGIMDISPAALSCNLGYACFQNRHYYFETSVKRSRDDAAKFCLAINMSLVSIEDCAEDSFISNMIKNNECYKNLFWTSGYRDETDTWYWGTGKTFDYTNWMRANPSYGKNQACVAYYSNYVQWSDVVCSNKYYFICESQNACA